MDDPSWTWPAWKFDMKRGDLFTKLHDQYNTYPSPIQDPDAFHHDIFEISQQANSIAEFHRLANTRRQQRLHELNNALESASLEIIANPSLVSTPQWEYCIQLFRTNSLDSLIRYFASYLPAENLGHPLCDTSAPMTSSTDLLPYLLPPDSSSAVTTDRSFEPCEQSECVDNEAPAVLFSFSEVGLERFPPQKSRSRVSRSEEKTDSNANMSTMPDSSMVKTMELGNGIVCKVPVAHPKQGLFAAQLAGPVDFTSRHSESQIDRQVPCRETAQAKTLPSEITAATLASRQSQITIALDYSIQSNNRARVGTKRKRL